MAKITMDGVEYEVSDGLTVVQASAEVGITVPHYCYHPELPAPANCRMCLIELTPPGAPGPIRQLATGCSTRVADGMVINHDTPQVKAGRALSLEALLAHHPLDCPTCDQAGECELQNFAHQFGKGVGNYAETKKLPPRKHLGPHVDIVATRCVTCTRCTRFTEEVSGDAVLGLTNRGGKNEIDIYPGIPLDNKLSGNVVDICPVGALLSTDFMYKSRPWFLDEVDSVCTRCSKGCNITVEHRDGETARVKPRFNEDVNGFWICDDGRYGYDFVNSPDRLRMPMARDGDDLVACGWSDVFDRITAAVNEAGGENVAVIASAWSTNEELHAVRRFATEAVRTSLVGLLSAAGDDEDTVYPGFTIRRDKNPNRTGAQQILGEEVAQDAAIWDVLKRAKAAVIFSGMPDAELSDDAVQALEALEFLAVVDTASSALTGLADIVIPGTAFTEKNGCFTNSEKRVQKLNAAHGPLGASMREWEFVKYAAEALGADFDYADEASVTADLVASTPAFEGVTPEAVGERGYVLGSGEAEPETNTGNYAYAKMFWK